MRRTKTHLPADLQSYRRRLNSYRKRRREEALEAVRQFSPDQLLPLAAAATQPIEGSIRRVFLFNPIIWTELFLPITWKVLLLLHQPMPFKGWAAGVMMFVMLVPLIMMFYGMASEPTRLYKALRDVIADRQEACLLGQALELHRWGEWGYVTMKESGNLKNLLPAIEQMVRRMEPGDYADLTAQQKATLLRLLKSSPNHPSLVLALLESLQTVGDKSAMDRVARLARRGAATPQQKQVQEAARQCLAAMQRENSREQQARWLLRASDASTTATSHILLRPAAADTNVDAASDQLLRATDSEASC